MSFPHFPDADVVLSAAAFNDVSPSFVMLDPATVVDSVSFSVPQFKAQTGLFSSQLKSIKQKT